MTEANGTAADLRSILLLLADPAARAYPVDDLKSLPGRTIYVRRWNLLDQRQATEIFEDKTDPPAVKSASLLRLILCRPDGTPLFPDDDDGVYQVPRDVANEVIDRALELNGLGKGAADRGKANSPTPPTPT